MDTTHYAGEMPDYPCDDEGEPDAGYYDNDVNTPGADDDESGSDD